MLALPPAMYPEVRVGRRAPYRRFAGGASSRVYRVGDVRGGFVGKDARVRLER